MSALFISALKNCFKINRTFHTKRLNLCYNPSQFFDQKRNKNDGFNPFLYYPSQY